MRSTTGPAISATDTMASETPSEIPSPMPPEFADRPAPVSAIRIRGARVHNLKNVDLDIPRNRLTVITGLSGAGKSSLAFNTLYAEGQRQYIESLSATARKTLRQVERPDVDWIDGLEPTVCIDQRRGPASRRSTVSTLSEIQSYLAVLFARLGEVFCPRCGRPMQRVSRERIASRVMELPEGTKLILLAPMAKTAGETWADALGRASRDGFVRIRLVGELLDFEQLAGRPIPDDGPPPEIVVDRLIVRGSIRRRLEDSLQVAGDVGRGVIRISHDGPRDPVRAGEETASAGTVSSSGWTEWEFTTRDGCAACGTELRPIEPQTFGINSPHGMCITCEGLGVRPGFLPEAVLGGSSVPRSPNKLGIWPRLDAARRQEVKALWARVVTPDDDSHRGGVSPALWQDGPDGQAGLTTILEKAWATADEVDDLAVWDAIRTETTCPDCVGTRLGSTARSVRLGGRTIVPWLTTPIAELPDWPTTLEIPAEMTRVAEPIVAEIARRLTFLDAVGLGYLTLSRGADTLSGGELQRVRLATCLGSGMVGVCYVLDEPTAGLHPRDTARLIEAIRCLQARGNTLVVVEHDEDVMRQADLLVDVGPGAGAAGGRIVAVGSPDAVARTDGSPTGAYLAGRVGHGLPTRRTGPVDASIVLAGVTVHNLRDLTVTIPTGRLVCVTGVSGSGKSSLIVDTLAPAIRQRLSRRGQPPTTFTKLDLPPKLERLVEVDQSPIGRSPKSSPATYSGLFDAIRELFAETKEARRRGYKPSRFSFNVKGGRCETCAGQGTVRLPMDFLPDVFVTCPDCGGSRYNRLTLQVRWRDLSIADVLGLSFDRAREVFTNVPTIAPVVEKFCEVGLGYLTLGQPATTLSGGEAQRVRLAQHLARGGTGRTLFLLDEPTSGLHRADIARLLDILERLVDRGHTVLVIEHHLDVIAAADWVIDMGPEAGDAGGRIVAEGPPETIAATEGSLTGAALRPVLVAAGRLAAVR